MIKLLALTTVLVCALSAPVAYGESIRPDYDFTITVPDGWESLQRNFSERMDSRVARVFDCVDEDPARLKQAGWKLAEGQDAGLDATQDAGSDTGKVLGAYCISYRKEGMRPAAVLLHYSRGEQHETLVKKFIDTYAGEIEGGYQKREMPLRDMSADLFEAGADLILIIDGRVSDESGSYIRSATIILHDDSLINIGTVYAEDAPAKVKEELEAMPLSVVWKQ